MASSRFSIDGWRAAGFVGFVPLLSLDRGAVPAQPGVYAVLRSSTNDPAFGASSGGWFKGKDPNVSPDELAANWVVGTPTVYIGKAGTSLADRLAAYRSFGHGTAIGHWGGRYIWHLADRAELLVCWAIVADGPAGDEESRLIADFRNEYGCRPFTNLRD